MTIFVVISGFIAIYEAIDHSSYRRLLGVHSVKRGINYFYLISFFGSGPSLAIFLFLYVLIWHYVHYALKVVIKKKDVFKIVYFPLRFLALKLGLTFNSGLLCLRPLDFFPELVKPL